MVKYYISSLFNSSIRNFLMDVICCLKKSGFLFSNIHHAKLPPYSPNLNKIEDLWGWLKNSVVILTPENICQPKCITSERIGNIVQKMANEYAHEYNNVFFSSRNEIKTAVAKFIDWVNTIPQTVIARLCL